MKKRYKAITDSLISIVLGTIMIGIGVWIFGPIVVGTLALLTAWLKQAIKRSFS